jgi:hypothetical protein
VSSAAVRISQKTKVGLSYIQVIMLKRRDCPKSQLPKFSFNMKDNSEAGLFPPSGNWMYLTPVIASISHSIRTIPGQSRQLSLYIELFSTDMDRHQACIETMSKLKKSNKFYLRQYKFLT